MNLFDLDDPFAEWRMPRSTLHVRDDGVILSALMGGESCGDCDWSARIAATGADGERLALDVRTRVIGRLGLDRRTGLFAWFESPQDDGPLALSWLDVKGGDIVVDATADVEPPVAGRVLYPLGTAAGPAGDVYLLARTADGPYLYRFAAP